MPSANAPTITGSAKSSRRASGVSDAPDRAGRRAHASTSASGYSSTVENNSGATSALNNPPSTPPTDMLR